MCGLKVKWLVHPHRFPRLCSAESRAHLLPWLKGNKAAQDKALSYRQFVASSFGPGMEMARVAKGLSRPGRQDTWDWLLLCGCRHEFSCAALLEKWLKSEAKCHIARPLKSGLKGKEDDCQSVSCSQSTPGPEAVFNRVAKQLVRDWPLGGCGQRRGKRREHWLSISLNLFRSSSLPGRLRSLRLQPGESLTSYENLLSDTLI